MLWSFITVYSCLIRYICKRISETACDDNFTPCSNGQCLPSEWWCDNEVDCSDGADEYNCGELGILKKKTFIVFYLF